MTLIWALLLILCLVLTIGAFYNAWLVRRLYLMAKTKKIKSVYFCMDQDGLTKGYQLSIDMDYEDGTGSGTRLAGPKYCGMGKRLKTVVIGKQELETLEKYIKLAKKWHKQADTEESKLA